ncbi:MAG: Wzz/FepE/Etk N-terminal domain-containing protein, partial [Eudoraea sp.]
MESNSSSLVNNNNLDYKELIRPYLKHWKWFIISLVIALCLSLIYLRYATPLFAAEAKIQIIVDPTAASQLSTFNDLGMLST